MAHASNRLLKPEQKVNPTPFTRTSLVNHIPAKKSGANEFRRPKFGRERSDPAPGVAKLHTMSQLSRRRSQLGQFVGAKEGVAVAAVSFNIA